MLLLCRNDSIDFVRENKERVTEKLAKELQDNMKLKECPFA